jgi:hypothetical protein
LIEIVTVSGDFSARAKQDTNSNISGYRGQPRRRRWPDPSGNIRHPARKSGGAIVGTKRIPVYPDAAGDQGIGGAAKDGRVALQYTACRWR